MSETNGTTTRTRRAMYKKDIEQMTLTQSVVGGRQSHVYAISALNPEIRARLTLHGLNQKLGDGHASKEVDVAAATDRIWDGLIAGHWSTRGEGAERTTMFITAYANVTKTDIDLVRSRVNALSDSDNPDDAKKLKAFREHPSIVAEISRLQIEAARKRAQDAKKTEPTVDLMGMVA